MKTKTGEEQMPNLKVVKTQMHFDDNRLEEKWRGPCEHRRIRIQKAGACEMEISFHYFGCKPTIINTYFSLAPAQELFLKSKAIIAIMSLTLLFDAGINLTIKKPIALSFQQQIIKNE